MMKYLKSLILITSCLFLSSYSIAGGVYQEPDNFIKQAFDGKPPKAKALWLDKDLKKQIADILDHNYKGLRVRYWQENAEANRTTAWILEEIGKEKPITTGIVISNSKIKQVKVLIFRESRGWEVRHDFFSDQFKQAELVEDNQLNTNIDNISGATLSVRAVKKLAQIALLLDKTLLEKETLDKAAQKS